MDDTWKNIAALNIVLGVSSRESTSKSNLTGVQYEYLLYAQTAVSVLTSSLLPVAADPLYTLAAGLVFDISATPSSCIAVPSLSSSRIPAFASRIDAPFVLPEVRHASGVIDMRSK